MLYYPLMLKTGVYGDTHARTHARTHTQSIIIIIIMYIYHALINALRVHMIHINLNMIFYSYTRRAQSHPNNPHKAPYG